MLAKQADPARQWRCIYRWIVQDDRVLGGIALRQGDNQVITDIGHIGYGIRPSSRGRGVGTWALRQMLDLAAEAGMNEVSLVCEVDNTASIKTIENNGGALEGVRETENGSVRRYRIDLNR
ncbi:putative acetyltransferase [Nakamurella sp. UYEF19]|uniref:GNAT family N-acetyltransferase n=1 Tax=Nakamurella sp. UYEF19 TaxID=1756392 RepID=UPI0033975A17